MLGAIIGDIVGSVYEFNNIKTTDFPLFGDEREGTLMLGAIIGDIVGSVYEFNNIKTTDFPLFGDESGFTDDTVMTIAVGEALMESGRSESYVRAMKKYGALYPYAGYGGMFLSWLDSSDTKPYNSFGNGSAMRVSPVAWWYATLEMVEQGAEDSAAVTHNHPEGIKGAQATAAAIFLARSGESKDAIRSYIEGKYGYNLRRTLDEIRPLYRFNETCQETVPEAIIAYLESDDFEDAIRNAISLGGDSDTLAAITGSIAGGEYRISKATARTALEHLDDTLAEVLNAWYEVEAVNQEELLKRINNKKRRKGPLYDFYAGPPKKGTKIITREELLKKIEEEEKT